MIIKSICIGNENEAYINSEFKERLNIIFSDDNDKGKTIVIQAIMYCMGNDKPMFPASFKYKDYYYILGIESNGKDYKVLRKAKNIIISGINGNAMFDNISEFKRYWNEVIEEIPIINKDNVEKIADPELFLQVFFSGQDKKNTSDITNVGYYKKEDFYNLLCSMGNIRENTNTKIDIKQVKSEIKSLKNEKENLLTENKILKSNNYAIEYLSMTNDRLALENILKQADEIKETLLALKRDRNKSIARKKKNELLLRELRSLNRNMKIGEIKCMDCGSNRVVYESADEEFSFDISTAEIRGRILNSIKEKINIYDEEIERITSEINNKQEEFDKCLELDNNVSLDILLALKREIDESKDADKRIVQIEKELVELKAKLEVKDAVSKNIEEKKKKLLDSIVEEMNEFYRHIDSSSTNKYSGIFTPRDSVYSGSEGTEFQLARIYAYQRILKHNYPIVVDSFRAEDLSTEREEIALNEFEKIDNQIIFTTTLKKEEEGKYIDRKNINAIDFSENETYHILSKKYVERFYEEMDKLAVKI